MNSPLNTLHEIQIYNMLKDIQPQSIEKFREKLYIININNEDDNLQYYHLLDMVEKSLKEYSNTKSIQSLKQIILNIRNIAIYSRYKNITPITSCDCESSNFHLCEYFSKVLNNTISESIVKALLDGCKKAWTNKMIAKLKDSNHFSREYKLYKIVKLNQFTEFLFLFFSGQNYGNEDLFQVLRTTKKQHELESKDTIHDSEVNYFYTYLLPMLDNVEIIDIRNGNYNMLYRAFQCLHFISGNIDEFYSILSKYQINFLNEEQCIIKNYIFLNSISPPNSPYIHLFISKFLFSDIFQFYGYDSLWNQSNFFGNILRIITTQKDEIEMDRNHSFKIQINTKLIPSMLTSMVGKEDNHQNLIKEQEQLNFHINDVYSIINYISCVYTNINIKIFLSSFWRKIFDYKKKILLNSKHKRITYKERIESIIDNSYDIVSQLLQEEGNIDINLNKEKELVSIIFCSTKYTRTKSIPACSSFLLLFGITICGLEEGLNPYTMQHYIKNIYKTVHWCNKDIYQKVQFALVDHSDLPFQRILKQPINFEWTPIIFGLVHILSSFLSNNNICQWENVYSFLNQIFVGRDNFERDPSLQLLQIEYFYNTNEKKMYFIPLLRSACLFYGGIAMLQKIEQSITVSDECKKNRPSISGFMELVNIFHHMTTIQSQTKDIITSFLCHELFSKFDSVSIIEKWDYSFPFYMHIKESFSFIN